MYFFHYRNVADDNIIKNQFFKKLHKQILSASELCITILIICTENTEKKLIMALEEVKSMLRAVLMSCKEGVPAYVLQSKYTWLVLLKVF